MPSINRQIAVSVLAWTVVGSAALAVRSVAAPKTTRDETPRAKFEVYKDRGGEFRWRLRATNSQVMAIAPDGYKDKRDCLSAIDSVKRDVENAPVKDVSDETPGAADTDHKNPNSQGAPTNAKRGK